MRYMSKETPRRKCFLSMLETITAQRLELSKQIEALKIELQDYLIAASEMNKVKIPASVKTNFEHYVSSTQNQIINLNGLHSQQGYLMSLLELGLKHWKV